MAQKEGSGVKDNALKDILYVDRGTSGRAIRNMRRDVPRRSCHRMPFLKWVKPVCASMEMIYHVQCDIGWPVRGGDLEDEIRASGQAHLIIPKESRVEVV